jgi:hypothetical protein
MELVVVSSPPAWKINARTSWHAITEAFYENAMSFASSLSKLPLTVNDTMFL